MPIVALSRNHTADVEMNTKAPIATMPMICGINCAVPPPMNRPALTAAAAGQTVGSANSPTHSVPKMPFTRWTDVAPTGSSSFILSKKSTANTTSTPAMRPMRRALPMPTKAHGAVIATRPARPPLSVMLRSGLPPMNQIVMSALIDAAAAAVLVVTAIWPIEAQSAAIVEPGLNPNQPNQRTNTPIVAEVMLWPGIGIALPSL